MWHIVRAEWRNSWKMLLFMFVQTHAILAIASVVSQKYFGPSMLGVGILFPALMGFIYQWNNERSERRLTLWTSLPLSRTEVGMAYGMVLLMPWCLAALSSVGMALWWPDMQAALFSWTGLVLAQLAAIWLIAMVLGLFAGMVSGYVLFLGWPVVEIGVPSFWPWLQATGSGLGLYLLAAVLCLAALPCARRRVLKQGEQ
jgi:MFS family permease